MLSSVRLCLLRHLHLYFVFFFFFSSRRRHTRYIGDWSSDVCSSDLRFGWLVASKAASGRRTPKDRLARGLVKEGRPTVCSSRPLGRHRVSFLTHGRDRKSVV